MALLLQFTENGSGVKLPLNKQRTTIGRGANNTICLDDKLASNTHAVLEIISTEDDVSFMLQDLESTNHTFVNNIPVQLHKLKDGDLIRIGMSDFRFISHDPDAMDETSEIFKTWIPGIFYTGKKKNKK